MKSNQTSKPHESYFCIDNDSSSGRFIRGPESTLTCISRLMDAKNDDCPCFRMADVKGYYIDESTVLRMVLPSLDFRMKDSSFYLRMRLHLITDIYYIDVMP